ncbi:MAG: methyl-accepting chemotaxis protein [Desulfovibrio sp.]|nr:MAG: methyl-accepting chemotaxis protein [Desulfovibrio sp.]
MAEKKKKFKRKQLYIKKDFQLRFIVKFCIIVLLGSVLSTALVYYFSSDTLTSTFHNSRLALRTTSEVILPAIIYTNLITLAVISLAAVSVTLYISHKIAGPLYRFETDLELIAKGDLTKRIRLRKEDQLKDLANSLNTFVDTMHDRMAEIQTQVEETFDAVMRVAPESEAMRKVVGLRDMACRDIITEATKK